MKKADNNDKQTIIDLLTAAFEDNQSVNYIVRNDDKRRERIAALMDYSFEMCSLFGEVWLSDDRKACALVLYPQAKKATLSAILLDVKLIIKAIGLGGIKKALDRESKIKAKQSKEPMTYLWFIGVEPSEQGKGIGSKLLQEVIKDAETRQLPVYLETSAVKNLPWYERHGFKIYEQLDLTYTLYFLKR
ncbi:GNAT family N-acetyltransferase [Mucilaginibacter rubeus]|uniref:GNAT family N-acetyltransferase n=1 Tax=Mucilaginibacter rubeus TaxID=2027860 RepID=A0AAE6JE10_9SPHI|nr:MULTISPECIES: GNAT family N-acetyltransferase [Mucilaginibacter]QEM03092.1 GNAT family N-acetyltransferase [Mucilaginibacter rubeus]QEM15711.1 GNAT family N-acetyltransferase [Mucilaginibacter gossypii]QTE41550.1 GNAT family N-acetyltransferase [Mucilaginibacter rubeus]QTE48156.1 GNAT family N-acetyltransferase [Mucilaginibacter rubeus]QTE59547.1 GNAT family N-acetyltransferase [Mucilaginibacter rubeus]